MFLISLHVQLPGLSLKQRFMAVESPFPHFNKGYRNLTFSAHLTPPSLACGDSEKCQGECELFDTRCEFTPQSCVTAFRTAPQVETEQEHDSPESAGGVEGQGLSNRMMS